MAAASCGILLAILRCRGLTDRINREQARSQRFAQRSTDFHEDRQGGVIQRFAQRSTDFHEDRQGGVIQRFAQ